MDHKRRKEAAFQVVVTLSANSWDVAALIDDIYMSLAEAAGEIPGVETVDVEQIGEEEIE